MNLSEQIHRMKQMMGIISEESDEGCKVKNVNQNELDEYWGELKKLNGFNLQTARPELYELEKEKFKEVESFVTPILDTAKNYYLDYIQKDWFNKKVEEKINNTPNNNKKIIKSWGETEKTDLKNFINSVKLLFIPYPCTNTLGSVYPDKYDTIYFFTKCTYPNEKNKKEIEMILIHEFDHCVSFFFKTSKGIDFIPKDAKGPDYPNIFKPNYGNDSIENSARIKNLKRELGVDFFESTDNLKNLLVKKNINFIDKEGNLCKIIYENNKMVIYKTENMSEKINDLGYFSFLVNNGKFSDIAVLFRSFSEPIYKQNSEDKNTIIGWDIDLNKLFNYQQKFAQNKINNSQQTA